MKHSNTFVVGSLLIASCLIGIAFADDQSALSSTKSSIAGAMKTAKIKIQTAYASMKTCQPGATDSSTSCFTGKMSPKVKVITEGKVVNLKGYACTLEDRSTLIQIANDNIDTSLGERVNAKELTVGGDGC